MGLGMDVLTHESSAHFITAHMVQQAHHERRSQPSHPPYSASNSFSASFRSSGEFISAVTMGLETSIR